MSELTTVFQGMATAVAVLYYTTLVTMVCTSVASVFYVSDRIRAWGRQDA